MRKLLEWCRARGIQVELGRGSYYYPDSKRIEINWRLGRRMQLYHLLHECGHYLVAVGGGLEHANGDTRATETRIAVVQEEIEAWHRGRKLANRLGIKINRGRWAKVRKQSLATYLKWAANG